VTASGSVMSALPDEPTSAARLVMSEKCQFRKSAITTNLLFMAQENP
jgi:hypothetical protein